MSYKFNRFILRQFLIQVKFVNCNYSVILLLSTKSPGQNRQFLIQVKFIICNYSMYYYCLQSCQVTTKTEYSRTDKQHLFLMDFMSSIKLKSPQLLDFLNFKYTAEVYTASSFGLLFIPADSTREEFFPATATNAEWMPCSIWHAN